MENQVEPHWLVAQLREMEAQWETMKIQNNLT